MSLIEAGTYFGRMESALGRKIARSERALIVDRVEELGRMRQRLARSPPRAAIKRAIKAFARLSPGVMPAALLDAASRDQRPGGDNCGRPQRAEIQGALHAMGLPISDELPPPAYKAAALLALDEWQRGRSGPRKETLFRRELAKYAVALWKHLGHTDQKAWALEGKATPLVRFAGALFDLSATLIDGFGGSPDPSGVARLLREVIA